MYRSWPTQQDYSVALQNAATAFGRPELRRAEPEMNPLMLPKSASGQNAIVFPVSLDGTRLALRCYYGGSQSGEERRYEALARHLGSHPCALLAQAEWIEEGVRIRGEWYPIVVMEWVEGRKLNLYLDQIQSDRVAMEDLAERWREAVRELRLAKIVHGDLQHGNVLVDGSAIRLVDYDAIWVPCADLEPPVERGHYNFQHWRRLRNGEWNEHIDWFSALVIYVTIRVLAVRPDLRSPDNEKLLFGQSDYEAPDGTETWHAVRAIADPEIQRLADLLAEACKRPAELETDLEEVLSVGLPKASTTLERDLGWAEPFRDVTEDHWSGEAPVVSGPAHGDAWGELERWDAHAAGADDQPRRRVSAALVFALIAVVAALVILVVALNAGEDTSRKKPGAAPVEWVEPPGGPGAPAAV